MFERFSLPDVARVSRRTVLGSLIVGIVGLVAALALGAALVGLGLCVGLALGLVNFRMVQRSVVKVGDRPGENKRRPLAANTVLRLFAISAVALGLLFASFDLGFGIMGGLAVFQLMLLFNVARSMLRMGAAGLLPEGDAGEGGDDPSGGAGGRTEGAVTVPDDLTDGK